MISETPPPGSRPATNTKPAATGAQPDSTVKEWSSTVPVVSQISQQALTSNPAATASSKTARDTDEADPYIKCRKVSPSLLSHFLCHLEEEAHLTPWKLATLRPEKLDGCLEIEDATLSLKDLIHLETDTNDPSDAFREVMERCQSKSFLDLFVRAHVQKSPCDRYRSNIPYAHNCLKLEDGSYINASFAKSVRPFILTQLPIPTTDSHPGTTPAFWQMIWEQNCQEIVALDKTDPFYLCETSHFEVSLEKETDSGKTVVRHLLLTHKMTGERRVIAHTQMQDWPNETIPPAKRLLAFLQPFLKEEQGQGPLLVHCLAGLNRSSLFVILYSLLRLMKEIPNDADLEAYKINIPSWYYWMNTLRPMTLSDPQDLVILYDVLILYLRSKYSKKLSSS